MCVSTVCQDTHFMGQVRQQTISVSLRQMPEIRCFLEDGGLWQEEGRLSFYKLIVCLRPLDIFFEVSWKGKWHCNFG